jgi:tellurite resistance protein TehA-like permease
MGESVELVDAVILIAGLLLILFTSLRVSQRRTREKPVKGQTAALVGIAVWLGCLAVALYLIFG